MADAPAPFNPQSEAGDLQGAVARLKTAHGKVIAAPSAAPLFRIDQAGALVNRAGKILRDKLPEISFGKKAVK